MILAIGKFATLFHSVIKDSLLIWVTRVLSLIISRRDNSGWKDDEEDKAGAYTYSLLTYYSYVAYRLRSTGSLHE